MFATGLNVNIFDIGLNLARLDLSLVTLALALPMLMSKSIIALY